MEQRTYTRRQILKGGAAALLGASLPLPLATRKADALTRTVAVGVFPNGNGPLYGDPTELNAYIDLVGGVAPRLVSVFSRWMPLGSTTYLYPHTDDLASFYNTFPGSIMMWTWEPWGVTLQDIADGKHDAEYIDEVARRIKAVAPNRVLIRFAQEMNGHWPWPWLRKDEAGETIEQHAPVYNAAWKRVVDRFRAQGATNAEFVWSPNIISGSADDFTPWYPGHDYVDWVGLDAYNWGAVHGRWVEFDLLFRSSIDVITKLSPRGLIIAETGCHSTPPLGVTGDKGRWYDNMAASLKQNYPQLMGLVNHHNVSKQVNPPAEWRVDLPYSALDNWQALVKDPQFNQPLGAPVRSAVPSDTTAPKVNAVTPLNRATGVSPSANVTATFSEAMDAGTINGTTFNLFRLNADGTTSRVAAAVSYNRTAKKAVLNPNNNLRLGATYKAVVTTGAKDLAGNALDQYRTKAGNQVKTWKFTVRRS